MQGQNAAMTLVRRVARPMLASMFIAEGVGALRNPAPRAALAADVATPLAQRIPYLPEDPEALVKLNAAVMVGAGSMLALGRFPRISALLLGLSTIQTTITAHRFWEREDSKTQAEERTHFFKNVSLLGALLLAAVDTEGKPGVAWRVKHATQHTAATSRRARRTAAREAKLARASARAKLSV